MICLAVEIGWIRTRLLFFERHGHGSRTLWDAAAGFNLAGLTHLQQFQLPDIQNGISCGWRRHQDSGHWKTFRSSDWQPGECFLLLFLLWNPVNPDAIHPAAKKQTFKGAEGVVLP